MTISNNDIQLKIGTLLQAPDNIGAILKQAQAAINARGLNVRFNISEKDIRLLQSTVDKIKPAAIQLQGINNLHEAVDAVTEFSKASRNASSLVGELGKNLAITAKRFLIYQVASQAFFGLAGSISDSTKKAIEFDHQITRLSQVTGITRAQLSALKKEFLNTSVAFGIPINEVAKGAEILAQAGKSIQEIKTIVNQVAVTNLLPTFNTDPAKNIENTLTVLTQYRLEASKTSTVIDILNSVSKEFNVTSDEIFEGLKRSGSTFAAFGGALDTLSTQEEKLKSFTDSVALFTSVISNSRESAESIGTAFKTIIPRLQSTDTAKKLKDILGVDLRDAGGNLLRPLEAIQKVSEAFNKLPSNDPRTVDIVGALGGDRQSSRVINLLKSTESINRALASANNSGGSAAKDAQVAQEDLARSIQRVRDEFQKLIVELSDSGTFKAFANSLVAIASSMTQVAKSIEPVLPLLGAIAPLLAIVSARTFTDKFLRNIGPSIRPGYATGGLVPVSLMPGEMVIPPGLVNKIGLGNLKALNSGAAMVPGVGNSDSYPADLPGGSFVLRKSAVKRMGYARGGGVNSSGSLNLPSSLAAVSESEIASLKSTFFKDLANSGAMLNKRFRIINKEVTNLISTSRSLREAQERLARLYANLVPSVSTSGNFPMITSLEKSSRRTRPSQQKLLTGPPQQLLLTDQRAPFLAVPPPRPKPVYRYNNQALLPGPAPQLLLTDQRSPLLQVPPPRPRDPFDPPAAVRDAYKQGLMQGIADSVYGGPNALPSQFAPNRQNLSSRFGSFYKNKAVPLFGGDRFQLGAGFAGSLLAQSNNQGVAAAGSILTSTATGAFAGSLLGANGGPIGAFIGAILGAVSAIDKFAAAANDKAIALAISGTRDTKTLSEFNQAFDSNKIRAGRSSAASFTSALVFGSLKDNGSNILKALTFTPSIFSAKSRNTNLDKNLADLELGKLGDLQNKTSDALQKFQDLTQQTLSKSSSATINKDLEAVRQSVKKDPLLLAIQSKEFSNRVGSGSENVNQILEDQALLTAIALREFERTIVAEAKKNLEVAKTLDAVNRKFVDFQSVINQVTSNLNDVSFAFEKSKQAFSLTGGSGLRDQLGPTRNIFSEGLVGVNRDRLAGEISKLEQALGGGGSNFKSVANAALDFASVQNDLRKNLFSGKANGSDNAENFFRNTLGSRFQEQITSFFIRPENNGLSVTSFRENEAKINEFVDALKTQELSSSVDILSKSFDAVATRSAFLAESFDQLNKNQVNFQSSLIGFSRNQFDLAQQRRGLGGLTTPTNVSAIAGIANADANRFVGNISTQEKARQLSSLDQVVRSGGRLTPEESLKQQQLVAALELTANETRGLAAVEKKAIELEEKRQNARNILERIATGDTKARVEIDRGIADFLKIQGGGGSNLSADRRQNALDVFRQVGGGVFGLNKDQIENEVLKATSRLARGFVDANGQGFINQTIDRASNSGSDVQILTQQFDKIVATITQANQALLERQSADLENQFNRINEMANGGFQAQLQAIFQDFDQTKFAQSINQLSVLSGEGLKLSVESAPVTLNLNISAPELANLASSEPLREAMNSYIEQYISNNSAKIAQRLADV